MVLYARWASVGSAQIDNESSVMAKSSNSKYNRLSHVAITLVCVMAVRERFVARCWEWVDVASRASELLSHASQHGHQRWYSLSEDALSCSASTIHQSCHLELADDLYEFQA